MCVFNTQRHYAINLSSAWVHSCHLSLGSFWLSLALSSSPLSYWLVHAASHSYWLICQMHFALWSQQPQHWHVEDSYGDCGAQLSVLAQCGASSALPIESHNCNHKSQYSPLHAAPVLLSRCTSIPPYASHSAQAPGLTSVFACARACAPSITPSLCGLVHSVFKHGRLL